MCKTALNYYNTNATLFSSINRKMSWWSSNQSNMINGTDGAVFHPLINRNELLYIFAADLCRYVYVAFWLGEEVGTDL